MRTDWAVTKYAGLSAQGGYLAEAELGQRWSHMSLFNFLSLSREASASVRTSSLRASCCVPGSCLSHQQAREWASGCLQGCLHVTVKTKAQRYSGLSSVTQRESGTVWRKSEGSPAPNSHSCHCIRLIRSEGTGSRSGQDTSEKWNTSCHIRKQRCQSHQQLQPPWMVSW